jgi:hypothetical protein
MIAGDQSSSSPPSSCRLELALHRTKKRKGMAMNKRMPQQSQTYEKKRAAESNNIPHSNLRFDSPSGYRWLSSGVASGSAVSLVPEATGVSVGAGSVATTVAVSETVSVGAAVTVAPGDAIGV